MIKSLLIAMCLFGRLTVFNGVDYKFTKPLAVEFHGEEKGSKIFQDETATENFFLPGRIIFNNSIPVVERMSYLSAKDKDYYLLFSDPEYQTPLFAKEGKVKLVDHKKVAYKKVHLNKFYNRKILHK